jgi:hypothetical protein
MHGFHTSYETHELAEWQGGVQAPTDMPKSSPTALPIWITALVLGACKAAAPPPAEPVATEAPAPAAAPAASPMSGLIAPSEHDKSIDGVVTERLDAGRYSYLRLDGGDWVATTGDPAQVGQHVQVESFGARENFDSPRLGRRFDRVVFGIVRVTGA